MRRGDYIDGLRAAYLGEVAGAAFAQAFAAGTEEARERETCALIARLETATARIIAPLLDSLPDPEAIDAACRRGEATAERISDWATLIDYSAHGLDGYVEDFERLRDAAPAADRPALDLLVDHEHALRRFGLASIAGDSASDQPLRAALTAAERHLSART